MGEHNSKTRVEPTVSGHDDGHVEGVSFEALARRYNHGPALNAPLVFTQLVIGACQRLPKPRRIIDIGCGRGIARQAAHQRAIRAHVEDYWGLEPDEGVRPPPGLFDHHVVGTVEEGDLPKDAFDLAYSYMVMEHVADPAGFLSAVSRCLKPGGSYLFATPNRRHYFARIASALNAARLDETVLRIIKPGAAHDYHYPTRYRCNDERRINRCAQRAALLAPEYVYVEGPGVAGYLRGPLRPVYHLLAFKRRIIRRPEALATLVCRITKPKPAPASR